MKTILALSLSALLAAHALDIPVVQDKLVYRDCTNLRTQGDELLFLHAEGSARVRHDKLPAAVQAKYFDPAQVAQWAARRRAEEERQAAVQRERVVAEEAARQKKAAQADAVKKANAATLARQRTEHAEKAAADAAQERAKQARLENVRLGKWERFVATMIGPTSKGQIMRKPDGKTIHVERDLGKAQGEDYWGYFERSGNYEYTAAGGGAARVANYTIAGDAKDDIVEDSFRARRLNIARLKAKLNQGPPLTKKESDEMIHLMVVLEAEGVPKTLIPTLD